MRPGAGRKGDGPQGRKLLTGFRRGETGYVLGDTACDGDGTRAEVKRLKAKACIKPHKNRVERKRCDMGRHKHRKRAGRFFGRIKRYRRVATRYEKKPENFAGFIWLAWPPARRPKRRWDRARVSLPST